MKHIELPVIAMFAIGNMVASCHWESNGSADGGSPDGGTDSGGDTGQECVDEECAECEEGGTPCCGEMACQTYGCVAEGTSCCVPPWYADDELCPESSPSSGPCGYPSLSCSYPDEGYAGVNAACLCSGWDIEVLD